MLVIDRNDRRDAPDRSDVVLTLPTGATITVRVLSAAGGHVKLGVTAPADVRVRRGEVLRPGRPDPIEALDRLSEITRECIADGTYTPGNPAGGADHGG